LIKKLRNHGFETDKMFYTIAEIGINHNGDLDNAKKMIDSAARSNANSVKFQTYITEKRASKDSPIYDILKKCEFSFEKFEILKKHAEDQNIHFFSTPFDKESVEFLSEINCNIFKIASFDMTNYELLRNISETNTPTIMSTGMCNLEEIRSAYEIISSNHNNIAILHCISAYPTLPFDANLSAIFKLKSEFDCVIGQSDHTNDIHVPLYAAAMGAQIIEKHFKIDDNCADASVSIDEKQMHNLNSRLDELEKILGEGNLEITPAQANTVQFRRFSKRENK